MVGGTIPSEMIVKVYRYLNGSLLDTEPFEYTSPTITDAENHAITFTATGIAEISGAAFSNTGSTFKITLDRKKVLKSQISQIIVSLSDGYGVPVTISITVNV